MHSALERRLRDRTRYDLDVVLFANEDVFLDAASVGEVLAFAGIVETLTALNGEEYFADCAAHLEHIVLTPDFHRGAGIPVGTVLDGRGFVLPGPVGTDIGCGMRLLATDVTADGFAGLGEDFEARVRYIFFEGGRNIPLSAAQRTGIFGPASRRWLTVTTRAKASGTIGTSGRRKAISCARTGWVRSQPMVSLHLTTSSRARAPCSRATVKSAPLAAATISSTAHEATDGSERASRCSTFGPSAAESITVSVSTCVCPRSATEPDAT